MIKAHLVDLLSMRLHEVVKLEVAVISRTVIEPTATSDHYTTILRVPGGWIYYGPTTAGQAESKIGTFVSDGNGVLSTASPETSGLAQGER